MLNISPVYINGILLNFKDALGTGLSSAKFRLYTSKEAAAVDSVKKSFLNATADASGHFTLFNISANTYYIFATDSIGTKRINALDMIVVPATGLVPAKDVMLK